MEIDFKDKFQNLIGATSDILIAMFGFGFWKGCRLFDKYKDLYNPISDHLKDQWNADVFLDAIRASDSSDSVKDILYSKEGVSYNLYQLEKAVKFKRPAWVFFYLTGHLLGEVINSDLTRGDLDIYLENLSKAFKIEYGDKIVFLVNYFGEDLGLFLKSSNGDVKLVSSKGNC